MKDKARAEMANLAATETMVNGDTGYYVRLCDLADADLSATYISTDPHYGSGEGGTSNQGTFAYYNPDTGEDSTSCESELTKGHPWDGPYQVFQEKTTYQSDNGSVPAVDAGVTGWGANVPQGTPLDPWGHTYLVAYDDRPLPTGEYVMVIYSAGPDGKMQTGGRATVKGDSDGDGDVDYDASDDILYKFR